MQTIKVMDARNYNRKLVKTYSAVNATAGTGIAEAVVTAFAATAALCVFRNAGAAGLVRPKYLRLVSTVAPASGTSMNTRIALDTGATRYSSGGSTIVGKNRDMTNAATPNATFKVGAVVTAAATSNVRYVSQATPSAVIPVVGDNVVIVFGHNGDPENGAGGTSLGGTAARQIVVNVGPIVLGPSNEMIIHTWYPSNASTPPSWELEMCWEESLK